MKKAISSILLLFICIANTMYGCANQKVIGYIFINKEYSPCTLVDCNCCNECGGNIEAIIGNDTLNIFGEPRGQTIECIGSDCDLKNNTMVCKPFEMNKKYELTGKYECLGKAKSIKVFRVIDYKPINQ